MLSKMGLVTALAEQPSGVAKGGSVGECPRKNPGTRMFPDASDSAQLLVSVGSVMIRPGPGREMEGIATVRTGAVINRFIARIFAIFVGPIGRGRPLILDHNAAVVAGISATVIILNRGGFVGVLDSNNYLIIGSNGHSGIVTGNRSCPR